MNVFVLFYLAILIVPSPSGDAAQVRDGFRTYPTETACLAEYDRLAASARARAAGPASRWDAVAIPVRCVPRRVNAR